MKKYLFISAFLMLGIILNSCESNDSPVADTTMPPQNVPTSKVLVELFTNTSCVPCVEANQYLDAIYEFNGTTINDSNVIILRYHTTLFAGDPFYLYNTPDNNARMSYYPNSAIVNPRTYLLGIFMGNFSSATWTSKLNEKLIASRPFAITLLNVYDSVSRSGNVNVKITQPSGINFTGLVYHVALAENEVFYTAPNGETHFNNTLRDLVTPSGGQTFEIGSGQTVTLNNVYSVSTEINQNKSDLIVFVQVALTREVLGVEKIKVN